MASAPFGTSSVITEPLPVEWLRSKVGWSPFAGRELAGWPVTTVLRGEVAYHEHQLARPPAGRPLRFRL